jgi:hypothetical protein
VVVHSIIGSKGKTVIATPYDVFNARYSHQVSILTENVNILAYIFYQLYSLISYARKYEILSSETYIKNI